MNQPDLPEVEKYVRGLFNKFCNDSFTFHNLSHTEDVVARTIEICNAEDVSEANMLNVTIASWFHDTGYLFADPRVHEQKSVEIMMNYFYGNKITANIAVIAECILATKPPVHPKTLLQKIICDADTYHLGTDEFYISDEKVFHEFAIRHEGLTRHLFAEGTLHMLRTHRFFTNYCVGLLSKSKEAHISFIEEKIKLQS